VYVTVVGPQVTSTDDCALAIWKLALAVAPVWLLSPAYVALAEAVPAFTLFP
jgi:hypothetical protein